MELYTVHNNVTGEVKQFRYFKDFQDWYRRLTIAEMMSWSGWRLERR